MSSSSSSPKREEVNRVYVTGYSTKESQEDIKSEFTKYGEIAEFSWKGRFCFIVLFVPKNPRPMLNKKMQTMLSD